MELAHLQWGASSLTNDPPEVYNEGSIYLPQSYSIVDSWNITMDRPELSYYLNEVLKANLTLGFEDVNFIFSTGYGLVNKHIAA